MRVTRGMVELRWRGGWALLACLAACQPGHGADPAAQKGNPLARSDSSNPSPTPMASARSDTGTNAALKSGTGQLRTDAEPLLKRFPLLGRPLALQWMSGTLGDSRVPGPSTYWIDAIVDLPPEHAAWLRQNYGLPSAGSSATGSAATAEPPTAAIPNLTPALQALLAPGPWQSSRELNTALSQQGFLVRAYLQADRLVLVALGQ
jgi:hypothetical protein